MAYSLMIANYNYSSWSLRPWILMKMLGIPFEAEMHKFTGQDQWDEFRPFSPNGKVPCLHDGETVVWDSLGIALYLSDRHEGVWPEAAAARHWAYCATCEMHSGFVALRSRCPMNVGVRAKLPEISDTLARDLGRLRELWEEGLDRFGGPFLASSKFTAVDAFFAPVAWRVRSFDLDVGPKGRAWVDHMIAQDAMQEWERGALAETDREPMHEEEIADTEIVADYRANAAQ